MERKNIDEMTAEKEIRLRNMTAVYIEHEEKLLMLYRIGSRVVAPSWVGVGGHFEQEELNNPAACALRELSEETGLCEKDLQGMKLRYVILRLKNGEIRQNYYYFAKLNPSAQGVLPSLTSNEGTLAWVPMEEVLQKKMPLSAKQMLTHYLEVGRFDEKLYSGTTGEKNMTFAELKEF